MHGQRRARGCRPYTGTKNTKMALKLWSVQINKFLICWFLLSSCRTLRMEKSLRNGSAGKTRVWVCSVINFSHATQTARTRPSTTTSAWMMWPLSSVRLLFCHLNKLNYTISNHSDHSECHIPHSFWLLSLRNTLYECSCFNGQLMIPLVIMR